MKAILKTNLPSNVNTNKFIITNISRLLMTTTEDNKRRLPILMH